MTLGNIQMNIPPVIMRSGQRNPSPSLCDT